MRSVIRSALRRRYRALLDAPDRADATGNISAYPYLNTVIVDFLNHDERLDVDHRYAFGVVHGAYLASRLDVDQVTFLEFGTGRGGGVDKLERLAELVQGTFGVSVVVRTFDSGVGVPPPASLADMPHHHTPGSYADFDADVVRAGFHRDSTELIVGPFGETVPVYLQRDDPPVAFISFDMGSYSGTSTALRVVREARTDQLLPRVQCFFEGILAYTYASFNGDRRAIEEHNEDENTGGRLDWRRPLAPIHGLRYYAPRRLRDDPWVEKYYLAHITDHPQFTLPDGLLRKPPSALN